MIGSCLARFVEWYCARGSRSEWAMPDERKRQEHPTVLLGEQAFDIALIDFMMPNMEELRAVLEDVIESKQPPSAT